MDRSEIWMMKLERSQNFSKQEPKFRGFNRDFLDNSKRSASVVCTTNTQYLKLTKVDYSKLQTKEPLIAGKIMENMARVLAQRLRKTNDLIDQVRSL